MNPFDEEKVEYIGLDKIRNQNKTEIVEIFDSV